MQQDNKNRVAGLICQVVELQFRGNWGNLRTKTNFGKFNETREMNFSPQWGIAKQGGQSHALQ